MWPLGCLVIKSLLEIDYTCIPKHANCVRLQAKLESENPTGLPVGVVSIPKKKYKEYGNDKLQVLSAEDLLAKMLNREPEQYSDYKKDEYMNVC